MLDSQYWGINMKYSNEFKFMCVDLYKQRKWAETPAGIKDKTFHDMNRIWVRREDACGEDDLQHKKQNRSWTADE